MGAWKNFPLCPLKVSNGKKPLYQSCSDRGRHVQHLVHSIYSLGSGNDSSYTVQLQCIFPCFLAVHLFLLENSRTIYQEFPNSSLCGKYKNFSIRKDAISIKYFFFLRVKVITSLQQSIRHFSIYPLKWEWIPTYSIDPWILLLMSPPY